MKIVKKLSLLIIVLCFGFSGYSQKNSSDFMYCVSATVFQELDLMSINNPMGGNLTLAAGKLMLMGEYKHAFARIAPDQNLIPTDNFMAKIGFGGGGSSAEGYRKGFWNIGIQQLQFYKKLLLDESELPLDVNNYPINLDKVNVLAEGTQFSAGYQFMMRSKGKNVGYNSFTASFDVLFASNFSYSKRFEYSQYGFFVPQDARLDINIKQKHFGFKLRMEATTAAKIGLMIEMGVLPGITHKNNNYNDFNFGVRAGIIANLSFFKK